MSYDINHVGGDSTGRNDEELRRPKGTYDNLIVFIEMFPLRIFVVLAGMGFLLWFIFQSENFTPEGMLLADLAYLLGFGIVVVEAITGFATRLIKDALLRIVMRAERNSEIL